MKKENKLIVLCGFLLGAVLGFMFAPIKKGIHVEIKNNGNNVPVDER